MSLDAKRPRPVFPTGQLQFSTKKEKKSIGSLRSVPKAPPRSCPVPRILSHSVKNSPRLVSFAGDASDSFILESQSYNTKREESYFEQCFIIEDKLGAGSFGEVYRVKNKDNGKIYACKKTLIKFRGERDRLQRIEEVRKLQQLPRHSNCVEFFHAWEENLHLFLLTEACKSSLSEAVTKSRLSADQIWYYIVDILEGLNHLHLNSLIHMDLKPENIFLGMDNVCKIGDFGLVIDFSKGFPKEAVEGDPRYLAPECLQGIFTPAADMFSLGITILELVMDLDLPAHGAEWHELRMGKLPQVTDEIDPEMRNLLLSLLIPDPHARQTASQILKWPNIQKISSRKQIRQFIHSQVASFRHYTEPIYVLTHQVLSFISSFLNGFNFFKYKRKNDFNITPKNEESYITDPSCVSHNVSHCISDIPDLSDDEPVSFSPSAQIINSTPISTSQKKLPLRIKSSFWRNSHFEAEGDQSSKNSDLFPLESSDIEPEHLPPITTQENTSTILKTSRNLLDLFNQAQDSDEEET